MNNFTFGPCVVAAVASALRRKGLNFVCDCHLYVTNPQASVEVCVRHLPHSLPGRSPTCKTSVDQSQAMPTVSRERQRACSPTAWKCWESGTATLRAAGHAVTA